VPAFVTPARLTLFQLGLEQLDRADQARELIAKDGLVIEGKGAISHVHPATRVEKEAVAAVTKIFAILGVDSADLQLTMWEQKQHDEHGVNVDPEMADG